MESPKLTTFLITLVLITVFAGVFLLSTGYMANQYSQNIDNSSLKSLNDTYAPIEATTSEIRENVTNINTQSGIVDILGGIFNAGIGTLKLSMKSLGFFESMANETMGNVELGPTGVIFRNALITIVVILFVIGIVLAAILKWGL